MPYPNVPIDVLQYFGLNEIDAKTFRTKQNLPKPSPLSTGVYGGALVGQAIIAAMKTAPGYTPNSLNSSFLRPTSDKLEVEWQVETISQGRNFCTRQVKAMQNGKFTYLANISLSKKNSHINAKTEYEEYKKKLAALAEEKLARGNEDEDEDEDDDDDDVPEVLKPFEFQTPYPKLLSDNPPESLEVDTRQNDILVYHKNPKEMYDLSLTPHEELLQIAERKVSWYAQLGIKEGEINRPVLNGDSPEMQFFGLSYISDSFLLLLLARVIRIKSVNLSSLIHYWSVSLEHTVYFHDDDFDCTKWMGFSMRAMRLINGRVLLEAEVYNDKGFHVATVMQEGLIKFDSLKEEMKL